MSKNTGSHEDKASSPMYYDDAESGLPPIDFQAERFPYCIVWTPIPMLTWCFPFIGHMGIGMSNGVIRDFAAPYFVGEDNMTFGRPTRFLRLNPRHVVGGASAWDAAVSKASAIYETRMHYICCDNCHSHVATALCEMRYKNRTNWNMIILCLWMFTYGRYVGVIGFMKTWMPFLFIVTVACLFVTFVKFAII